MFRDFRIELALKGDLEAWAARTKVQLLTGIRDAAYEEGRADLEWLRAEVKQAGLGEGLANAWRMDFKPAKGLSYAPAVFLYSKAAHIIDAFTRAEPIKGKPFIAIPIEGSPADALRIKRGQKRTEEIERRYGPMRVVALKGGGLMLVARGRATADGGVTRLTRRRATGTENYFTPLNQKNQVDIPMFWLVPDVHLTRRLDWPKQVPEMRRSFAGRVESNLRKRLSTDSQASKDWRDMPAMMVDDWGHPIAASGPPGLYGAALAEWQDKNGWGT